jgi:hypothetical protein
MKSSMTTFYTGMIKCCEIPCDHKRQIINMKNYFFLSFSCRAVFLAFSAQEFSLGLSLDFHLQGWLKKTILFGDAQTGYHVGLFGRLEFGGFVTTWLLYTKANGTFRSMVPNLVGDRNKYSQDLTDWTFLMLGRICLTMLEFQAGPCSIENIDSDLNGIIIPFRC